MKAIWHEATLAQSDDTVVVEGNRCSPASAINPVYFRERSSVKVFFFYSVDEPQIKS
jgi:hypothetical protein